MSELTYKLIKKFPFQIVVKKRKTNVSLVSKTYFANLLHAPKKNIQNLVVFGSSSLYFLNF